MTEFLVRRAGECFELRLVALYWPGKQSDLAKFLFKLIHDAGKVPLDQITFALPKVNCIIRVIGVYEALTFF